MPEKHYLTDETVSLRPLEDSDAAQLAEWINDQAVLHYLGVTGMLTEGEELDWIQRIRKSSADIVLGIIDNSDDLLVGTIGLHQINRRDSNAMYGIMLGDTSRWSRGLGTAAGMLMCNHAFNSLNLHRLHLSVAAYNSRGVRSYEKIGFRPEGTMREHVFRQGKYHDVHFMGLLRKEFNELHAGWIGRQAARYGLAE